MGSLDGFLSTWSAANATFGQGAPTEGSQVDQSGQLQQMQQRVQSATPGSAWTGSGADTYSDANAKHATTIGNIADLDKRLGTEVNRSAEVVTAGRRDLEAVRKWVVDAAATIPNTKDRDKLLWPIVSKGAGEISDIIRRSNGDLAAIGGRIQGIGNEYQALGDGEKKPGDEGKDPVDKLGGKPGDPTPEEAQRAQDAVTHVLAGTATEDEKKLVRDGLALTPPQQADYDAGRHVDLSTQQKLVLGQMQGQMHDMSTSDIKTSEQRLGNDKHLVGDALQMMSSPQFDYTKTLPLGPYGQLTSTFPGGDGDQLPTAVKEALTTPAAKTDILAIPGGPPTPITSYPTIDKLHDLAGIVHDGNPALQQGTYLDRGLMDRGAEMLHGEEQDALNPSVVSSNQSQVDPTVQDIFSAAGRDTIVDHDVLTGAGGTQLLHDTSVHDWADNGHAASTLTDWVHNAATSSNEALSTRAGETAHAVAAFMSDPSQNLTSIKTDIFTDGHTTIGARNPDLLQGFSNALTPYQNAMVGDYTGTHGFAALDDLEHGKLPNTQQIFAVMDTDETAGKVFNERAYENALAYEKQYGIAAANHDTGPNSPHRLDMMRAGALSGMVEAGADKASGFTDTQSSSNAQAAYDIKKKALDFMFDKGIGHIPIAGDIINSMGKDAIVEAFVGERPEDNKGTPVFHHSIQDAQNQADYNVAAAVIANDPNSGLPHTYINEATGQLKGPAEIPEGQRADYYASLRSYLDTHGLGNAIDQEFRNSYDNQTRK